MSCCGRGWRSPALWPAGGRADGRRDLAGDGSSLWREACLHDLGRGTILVLRCPAPGRREPETNGVAERFIRTLKEQVVFGRTFQDIEEVRAAVRTYFDRYNQHWLLEKNGYRSPAETRRNWMAATITTHEAA